MELSEYGIIYQMRGPIKSQFLVDFILEWCIGESEGEKPWVLFVDGSSNLKGSRAGIILEGPDGIMIKQSLRFSFKASNNQAEYEALIAGLHLAKDMGVADLTVQSDS